MAGDSQDGFESGDDIYFDFHPDGTVTGKLGCNDFTAKAFFSGVHVSFRDPALTTHRTCPAPNMQDEGMASTSCRAHSITSTGPAARIWACTRGRTP
ncbi:META domain-containing protein [Streptomyces sp. NPDC050636]|uniref:META domain-containing protein n=1 Tax=Streptomyces sp. NPDC050636 TaxID=3154510 RepID=UPI0034271363